MAPCKLIKFEFGQTKFELYWDNVDGTLKDNNDKARQFAESPEGQPFFQRLASLVKEMLEDPSMSEKDTLAKLIEFHMAEDLASKVVQWFKKIVKEWATDLTPQHGESRQMTCCFATCSTTSSLVDKDNNVLDKLSMDLTKQGAFLNWCAEEFYDNPPEGEEFGGKIRPVGIIHPMWKLPRDKDFCVGDGCSGMLPMSKNIGSILDSGVYIMQPNIILGKAMSDHSPAKLGFTKPQLARVEAPKAISELFHSNFQFGKQLGRYLCAKMSSSPSPAPYVPVPANPATNSNQGPGEQPEAPEPKKWEPKWRKGQFLTLPQGKFKFDCDDDPLRVKVTPLKDGNFKVSGSRVTSNAYTQKICCKHQGKKVKNGTAVVTLDLKDADATQIEVEKPLDVDGTMELVLDKDVMKSDFRLDVRTEEGGWLPTINLTIHPKPESGMAKLSADDDPPGFDEQVVDVVIMIDTSSSMGRIDSPNPKSRIERVKELALELIDKTIFPKEKGKAPLRVAVMVWNSEQKWLSADGKHLQWYDEKNVSELKALINQQRAGGGTVMQGALQKLLDDPEVKTVKHIELLCDGDVGTLARQEHWTSMSQPFIDSNVDCTLTAFGKEVNVNQMHGMSGTWVTFNHRQ